MEQQGRLRRQNRYAAPEWGDTASTHLTGVTFDMSRRGLTGEQYGWILAYMLPLKESGMIDPIEESQPVLHVVVFEKYSESFDEKNSWSEANEPTEAGHLSAKSRSSLFARSRRASRSTGCSGVSYQSLCIRARLQPCRKWPRYGLGFRCEVSIGCCPFGQELGS
jgi:hypothetical protein